MATRLRDTVAFRGDRLFDGAVNLDWFLDDPGRAAKAAQAFVFHGPKYHGVTQADVGTAHGHRLEDTAAFARGVVRACCGLQDDPFSLAIAGYGTGKSHLALALAMLLSDPTGPAAEGVLASLDAADVAIGAETRAMLAEQNRPVLVVALNGMRNFDLTAEVTRQVLHQVRKLGLDTRRIDELRPRFAQAAKLVGVSNESTIAELLEECDATDTEQLLNALSDNDEVIYGRVQAFYAARGMPIAALGGESVRDVIEAAVGEYCGEGGPFSRLLVLFDEFGRYTEFATLRSQIAGSGVLQDLFEGVQAHADAACFVGFIQFELNAYVQRVAPEYRNEILRYVTRYQAARKVYLSINLETLMASLLEKRDAEQLDSWFDSDHSRQSSERTMSAINKWFPHSANSPLWTTSDQFHGVVRRGCWPLSPYATWFLFSLASAGKHLQERSALALLADAIARSAEEVVAGDGSPLLSPTDLWSDALQQELITSEEGGQQGSMTLAYASVEARHGGQLPPDARRMLRAIVMASKVGLQAEDRDAAIEALAAMSGLGVDAAHQQGQLLQDEYNVIEWDERFRSFDILGDAVPRSQFLAFLRQRVASSYDDLGKAALFVSRAAEWCDLLGDLDCDFAERNSITTREWRYSGQASNAMFLDTHFKYAIERWRGALGVDEPRGTVVYCYVEQGRDPQTFAAQARKQLRAAVREAGVEPPPILVVLLCDTDGQLGRALAEVAVLDGSLSAEDASRFGNLVGAHREKTLAVIRSLVDAMVKDRRYVTALPQELQEQRLSRVGTELFSLIYTKPLPFPFDGFATMKGNAADTCQQLTAELLLGGLDFDDIIAKPAKAKNRAVAVLKDCWGVFNKNGSVSRAPAHPVVKSVVQRWDQALKSEQGRIPVGSTLRDVCGQPHGANAASAGLLFGLFVAPRVEEVAIVRDGQQYAVAQWMQSGVFQGKLLDMSLLDEVELVRLGDTPSEWASLLDEWEQEESHSGRIACLRRAIDLKARVPVPPAVGYRLSYLEEQAAAALLAVQAAERDEDDAHSRVERGREAEDVSELSRGAAQLAELKERKTAETPLWTDRECEELDPHIERARQQITQIFGAWLQRQSPPSAKPDAVGEFKHKMLHLVAGNLRKLQLVDLCGQLELRVAEIVRNADNIAEANQLLLDVRSWLDQHSDACRVVRIAQIRGLRDVGKEHSGKLQGMSKRIEMAELSAAREAVAAFLDSLKVAEQEVTARAEGLWDCAVQTEADVQACLAEVEALTMAFEGCELDLEDLLLMSRALQVYQRGYELLRNGNLTWAEFEALSARLIEDAEASFSDNGPPWPPDEVFGAFHSIIAEEREREGGAWLKAIEADASKLRSMPAADANSLRMRLLRVPATLTEAQNERAAELLGETNTRLEALEVDGLLERFKVLPSDAQARFLELASAVVESGR